MQESPKRNLGYVSLLLGRQNTLNQSRVSSSRAARSQRDHQELVIHDAIGEQLQLIVVLM